MHKQPNYRPLVIGLFVANRKRRLVLAVALGAAALLPLVWFGIHDERTGEETS